MTFDPEVPWGLFCGTTVSVTATALARAVSLIDLNTHESRCWLLVKLLVAIMCFWQVMTTPWNTFHLALLLDDQ